MTEVVELTLPTEGVWRIGKATGPYEPRALLTPDELNNANAGNRFDSPGGNYAILYFGTTLQVCFGETLARFRPDPRLVPLVQGEWSSEGFMLPGEVPADWRRSRLAVRVRLAEAKSLFVDVEAARTRLVLAKRLAPILAAFGASDLDVSAVRSGDRRLTRAISHWVWLQATEDGTPRYAGIRYLSRMNDDWECWALFDRVATEEIVRLPITPEMAELRGIAELFELRIY